MKIIINIINCGGETHTTIEFSIPFHRHYTQTDRQTDKTDRQTDRKKAIKNITQSQKYPKTRSQKQKKWKYHAPPPAHVFT